MNEKLAQLFLPFVRRIAECHRRNLPPSVEIDDLVSVGSIGLLDAAKKYDPARKTSFRTYASYRIAGEIRDYLRRLDWAPRIERAAIKRGEATEKTMVSLDSLALPDAEGSPEEIVPDLSARAPGADATARDEARKALSGLPRREREILRLYYGEDRTLREIGEILSLSEARISQIVKQATERLRRNDAMSNGKCSTEGCGKPVLARGLCAKHYRQQRKQAGGKKAKPGNRAPTKAPPGRKNGSPLIALLKKLAREEAKAFYAEQATAPDIRGLVKEEIDKAFAEMLKS